MKEEILAIIEQIVSEKQNAKIEPAVALDIEIKAAVREKVLQALRSLYKEGKLDFGRTLNHNFAKAITNKYQYRWHIVKLHKII